MPVFHERMTWASAYSARALAMDTVMPPRTSGAFTRLTCLPMYHADPDGSQTRPELHLGLSGNILYSGDSTVRYRSRPKATSAPNVIDTGDIAADGALVAGAEAAWVTALSPSRASTCTRGYARTTGGAELLWPYASASWFLTGESRPYDRTTGAFARVIPKRNFDFGHGGWGAWEIAGRYSYANLDSANVNGGRLRMIMAGVNWYLHSHLKWRFEYGFGHVSDRQPSGNLNIFQTRIEADF